MYETGRVHRAMSDITRQPFATEEAALVAARLDRGMGVGPAVRGVTALDISDAEAELIDARLSYRLPRVA